MLVPGYRCFLKVFWHQLAGRSLSCSVSRSSSSSVTLVDDLRVLACGLEGFFRHPVESPDIDVVQHESWTIVGSAVSTIVDVILRRSERVVRGHRPEAYPIPRRVRKANSVIHTLREIGREIVCAPILSVLVFVLSAGDASQSSGHLP